MGACCIRRMSRSRRRGFDAGSSEDTLVSDIALFHAGRDGQTRKIATRVAERLRARGLEIDLRELDRVGPPPEEGELRAGRVVALFAAIRYGYHVPEAKRFVVRHRAALIERPFVFVSVNLTARKPGKSTPEGNRYLAKFLRRNDLAPVLSRAFAGRLDYPRYLWWERLLIQLIMTISGGPTDPAAVVEYTDWNDVDAFADRLIEIARGE